jgi:hypothetical protein
MRLKGKTAACFHSIKDNLSTPGPDSRTRRW